MEDSQLSVVSDGSRTFHQRTLCEELWNLRTEGTMCDVILDVAGEHLWAHRVILSACSSHFKHFFNKLAPTFSHVIKIENCSYKVCLRTLEHLYTGKTVLFSGSLLDEFNCLCKAWELKQPLFAPIETVSCGDILVDNPECARFSEESLASGANKCRSSESSCEEAQESDLMTLGHRELSKINDSEPKVSGDKITRQLQKRTLTSQISIKKACKKPKVAYVKFELDKQKSIAKTFEKTEHAGNLNYHSGSDTELDLIAAYNDDTDSSWDTGHDRVKIKEIPAKPQVRKKKQPRSKDKRNHSIKVSKKPSDVTRPHSRLRKKNYVKKWCKFLCRQCDVGFESQTELMQHRKDSHKKNADCARCQLQFPEKNQLLAHNMEHHWTEGIQLPEIYSCTVSGCTFNTHKRMSWYNHRLHAHPSECSICDICGKALKNELTLRQHKTVVHPTAPRKVFTCSTCEKVFKTESGMQKHMNVAHRPWTTERDRLVCPYCAHTCMLAESLTEHLYKKHDILTPSKKSYQCQYCDFKTTHVAEIRKHKIRHKPDKDKPFECDKCEKRFVDRGSLVSHQLKHKSSADLFRCQYCDYSTKYTHNLRAHVQVRHENKDHKPWKCDECSYCCNSKGNLYKHLRNVHKRTVETRYTVSRIGSDDLEGGNGDAAEMKQGADQLQKPQSPSCVPTKYEVEPGWNLNHNPPSGEIWSLHSHQGNSGVFTSGGGYGSDVSSGDGRHCNGVGSEPTARIIQPVSKPHATTHLPSPQPVPQYKYMVAMRSLSMQSHDVHHHLHTPHSPTLPSHLVPTLTQPPPPPSPSHSVPTLTQPPPPSHSVSTLTQPQSSSHSVPTISQPPPPSHSVPILTQAQQLSHSVPTLTQNPPPSHSVPTLTQPPPPSHSVPTLTQPQSSSHSVPTISQPPPPSHSVPILTQAQPLSHSVPTLTQNPPLSHSVPTLTQPPPPPSHSHSVPTLRQAPPPVQLPPSSDISTLLYPYQGF